MERLVLSLWRFMQGKLSFWPLWFLKYWTLFYRSLKGHNPPPRLLQNFFSSSFVLICAVKIVFAAAISDMCYYFVIAVKTLGPLASFIKPSVRNLGVILDRTLSLNSHVKLLVFPVFIIWKKLRSWVKLCPDLRWRWSFMPSFHHVSTTATLFLPV